MKSIFMCFSILFATSPVLCNAAEVTTLSAADAAKIRTIKVISTIQQDHLLAQGDPFFPAWVGAYASHGGLIPVVLAALIGSAATQEQDQNARALLQKQTNDVSGLNFRNEFWDSLRAELAKSERFRAPALIRSSTREIKDDNNSPEADATLSLDTVYSLAVGLKQLTMVTRVSMRLKDANADVLQTSYLYLTNFIVPFRETPEKALSAWTENNGAFLQTVLRRGISTTTRMLRYDLLQNNPPVTQPEQYGFDKLRAGGLKADCAQIFEVEGEKAENVVCRRKGGTIAAGELLEIARKSMNAGVAPPAKP